MRELLLQADVTVPSTTPAQSVIAAFVTILLLLGIAIAYRRSKVLGLDNTQRQVREDARAQRRHQTAAELKLSTDEVATLSDHELQSRVDALFDADVEETITRLPAVGKGIYRALSEAWGNRVGWLPALARRAVGLAAMVVMLGAVAVSGDAVVRLLQTDPSAPSTGSVLGSIHGLRDSGVDIVGTYPYGGELWQLAYASSILVVQWLYQQWALVAAALLVSAMSVVALDRRLDDGVVPERLIQSRRLAAGTVLVGVIAVWATGVLGIVIADAVGSPTLFGLALPSLVGALLTAVVASILQSERTYRVMQAVGLGFVLSSLAGESWGAVLGLWLSVVTAAVFITTVGPTAIRRIRRGISRVAGADAHPVAAFVALQRLLAGLSVTAAGLVVIYAVAGVANGQWQAVLRAAATAPPETQALLGAGTIGFIALVAVAFRESWPDVREELRAAFAQQAVRMSVLRRGVPWVGVFFSYVFSSMLLDRILLGLVVAVLIGVLLRVGFQLVDEAEYRADGRAIVRRLWYSKPSFIVVRAMRLDVDGRETYYAEVNGDEFLHVNRQHLVADVAGHADALATREKPPGTDSSEFATYVLNWGIPEPDDWSAKLDEKIRKAALQPFRGSVLPVIGSQQRRISHSEFESAFDDFDQERVRRRLREDDLYRYLDRGEQWVALERVPYGADNQRGSWPTLRGES